MRPLFLSTLILIASSCSGVHLRDAHQAFDQSTFEHAAFLSKTRLYVAGEGVALVALSPQSSDRASYLFVEELFSYSYRFRSLTRARALALLVYEDCIEKLNRHTEFEEVVGNYPFQSKDISILIRFYESEANNAVLPKPYIAIISIDKGQIRYYTYDTELGYELLQEEAIN